MSEVKIPKKLKPYFEEKLSHAKTMVDQYFLNHTERTKWDKCVKHWQRRIKKLNHQHNRG